MSLLLGIDCGGTNTKLLLAELQDGMPQAVRQQVLPTPRDGAAIGAVGEQVQSFLAGDVPDAFGVAVPGILDRRGVVLRSTNLPWFEGSAPAADLGSLLGLPGAAANDGTSAARAEVALGAGRGEQDVFILALGTGVAGAHVIGGEIRHGAHGGAGEIGHIGDFGDRLCSCGQRGCLETRIGGTQLARRWREVLEKPPARPVSARDLVDAARLGDPRAREILDQATSALATSLLGLVALVDPGMIVIGGGLSRAEDLLVVPTVAKLRERATFHQLPPIVPTALGMWGAAWGAVLEAEAAV